MEHRIDVPVNTPTVEIPVDVPGDGTQEPARKIAELFANKPMIKTLVSGIITIIASVFHFAVDDTVVVAIVDVIGILGMFVTIIMAQFEASRRATKQGEVTRNAVFSPATVARSGVPVEVTTVEKVG